MCRKVGWHYQDSRRGNTNEANMKISESILTSFIQDSFETLRRPVTMTATIDDKIQDGDRIRNFLP